MGENEEMEQMPQENVEMQPQESQPKEQVAQPTEAPAVNSQKSNSVGTIQEFAQMCEDYEAKYDRNLIIDAIAIMESPNIQQLVQRNPEVEGFYNGLGKFFPLLQDIMNGMMEEGEAEPMPEEPKQGAKVIDFDKIMEG